MQNNKYFGSYYPVESNIHKLNPIIKLVCLLIFILTMIGSMNIKLHLVILFFVFMMIYYSNVPIRLYIGMLYGLRYVYIFLLFMLASKGLSLENAITIFIKISLIIEYLMLIFYTTSNSELKYSIEKVLNVFNVFNLKLSKISFILTTGITFFPILITTDLEVVKSASSRGLDYFHGDILSRLIVQFNTIKNTLRLTINKIKKMKFMSELRLYNINRKMRTNLNTNKFNYRDVFYLLVHLIFIAFYIVFERGLL